MSFLRTAWAFLVRDFQTEASYRLSFMMSFFGMFVSCSLWYFMAGFISGNDRTRMLEMTDGLDYFSYVLSGLMIHRFLDVALHTYAGSIRTEQTTGTLEAMLVTPTQLGPIVLASSVFNFVFAALQASLYLVFGLIFFGVHPNVGSPLALIAAVGLTVIGMSGIGILSAAIVLYFKRGNPIDFLISTLSMLFGGTFIPPKALPESIRWMSDFIPTWHAAEAVRDAMFRGKNLAQTAPHLTSLAIFALVLVPIGLIGARIAVRRAKREGSLVQY